MLDELVVNRRYFLNTYLDAPILRNRRDKFFLLFKDLEEGVRHKRLDWAGGYLDLILFNKILEDETIKDVEPIESEQFHWAVRLGHDDEIGGDEISLAEHLTVDIMSKISEALELFTASPLSHSHSTVTPLSRETKSWYSSFSWWNKYIQELDKACAMSGPGCVRYDFPGGYILGTPNLAALIIDGHCLILTHEQVLAYKDAAFSRFQVLAACEWFYPSGLIYNLVVQSFEWQEHCLIRYGNAGYEVAKSVESLSKSYLSVISEDLFADDGAYHRMLQKVRDKEHKLGCHQEFMADKYHDILIKTTETQEVVELFGLLKLSGHPLIDPIVGGMSAADEARSDDKTWLSDALDLRNNFCRMYLEAYVAKHGKWPPMVFGDNKTRLHYYHQRQYTGLTRLSYPLTDWESVRFLPHQEFKMYDNFFELMDDKAISFYRSDVGTTWSRTPAKSQRRLLMEMIEREEINPREIVNLVMTGRIPKDWLIVSLYPKEREFKLAARMFSMMVFEMRLFFTMVEANMADTIFPYLPQQTMTKDSIAIQKMFLDLTRPISNADTLRLFLEVDLSRWNLRWRELTVHLVGSDLNDIFGTPNVFTTVHTFFEKSLIVVRVADLEPPGVHDETPPESDLLWYNHKGGFEGIAQKMWTACTYSMIDLALAPFNASYTLIGQGDNQVISMRVKRDLMSTEKDQLYALRSQVTERIAHQCSLVNQEVKPEECLESTTVITYSKNVYVSGVEYGTTLKFHSRLFPRASTEFPSVVSNVGAIFAGALTAAEKTRSPLISYALALFHSSCYLSRVSSYEGVYNVLLADRQLSSLKPLESLKTELYQKFLLTLPSEVGGWPVSPFTNFLYKGGGDPLSKSVAAIHLLSKVSRFFSRMYRDIQNGDYIDPEPSVMAILQDPYGLPIRKPPAPVDAVSRQTMSQLKDACKNKDISTILSADVSGFSEDLVNVLSLVRPFNPVLLRDILECSVDGVVQTVSRMFVATRTIQSLSRKTGSNIIDRLLYAGVTSVLYTIKRCAQLTIDSHKETTIYDLVVRLRKHWEKAGIPAPIGVTGLSPFDSSITWGKEAYTKLGVRVTLDCRALDKNGEPFLIRGPEDPYLGTRTREKRTEHGYKIVGSDLVSESFRKLQLILSQSGKDEDFMTLIDIVGLTRSSEYISVISPMLTGVVGGTIGHRYAARVGNRSAHMMGLSSFATHCIIDTDNCGEISGGQDDYPVMFQEYILLGISLLSKNPTIAKDMAYGSLCVSLGDKTVTPMPDERMTISSPWSLAPVRLEDCKLAYVPHLQLRRTHGPLQVYGIDIVGQHSDKNLSSSIKAAFASKVRTSLRNFGTSKKIVELGYGDSNVSIDLAELRGMGVKNCVNILSESVASEALSLVIPSLSKKREKYKLNSFCTTLSLSLANIISKHLGHPFFKDDPYVRAKSLYLGPVYSYNSRALAQDVGSLISQKALEILDNPSHRFFSSPTVLFLSDTDSSVSDTIREHIYKIVYHAFTTDAIAHRKLLEHTQCCVPTILRRCSKESERIIGLHRFSLLLSAWCLDAGYIYQSESFKNLAMGKRVLQIISSADEILRKVRSYEHWMVTREEIREWRLQLIDCEWEQPPNIPTNPDTECVVKWREPPERLSYAIEGLSRIERYSGRHYGLDSPALCDWIRVGKLFKDKKVLVIGSGNGMLASTMLLGGALEVWGHDLHEHMPRNKNAYSEYSPILVTFFKQQNRYQQTDQSFYSSGDWYDIQVARPLVSSLPDDFVIFFDIQSSDNTSPLAVLDNLVELGWRGTALVRLNYHKAYVRNLLDDLACSRGLIGYKVVHTSSLVADVLVCIRMDRVLKTSYMGENIITLPDQYVNTYNNKELGGGVDYILRKLTAPLGGLVGQTIHETYILMSECLASIAGSYETRPTHGSWTDIMTSAIAIFWLEKETKDYRLYKNWTTKRAVNISMGGVKLSTQYSSLLDRKITRVACRVFDLKQNR